MKRMIALLTAAVFIASSSSAFAVEFKPSPWVQKSPYAEKISHKLGFGILNLATGWTEIFWQPSKSRNKFAGLGKGILFAITDTAGGAIHAVTFPIPVDVPLPDGGLNYES